MKFNDGKTIFAYVRSKLHSGYITLSSGGSRISRRGAWTSYGGGVDFRGGYVSKILCVKTKESGPLGGRARRPLNPPMYDDKFIQ